MSGAKLTFIELHPKFPFMKVYNKITLLQWDIKPQIIAWGWKKPQACTTLIVLGFFVDQGGPLKWKNGIIL